MRGLWVEHVRLQEDGLPVVVPWGEQLLVQELVQLLDRPPAGPGETRLVQKPKKLLDDLTGVSRALFKQQHQQVIELCVLLRAFIALRL